MTFFSMQRYNFTGIKKSIKMRYFMHFTTVYTEIGVVRTG